MHFLKNPRRLMSLALALAVLASLTLGSATGLAVATMDVVQNGGFESGFVYIPGCGMVGANWGCFTNGGSAAYGFYDDQWGPVLADGQHSQLIEINTKQFAASEPDRFAGIYQTVALTKGGTYTLKMKGGMREHQPDPTEDKFRYRVQWGYTTDGSTDWTQVTNWVELPWDKIDDRLNPTGLLSYSTSFKAPSGQVTLFIRAWKKWGNAYKELDVNIDSVSLTGQIVKQPVVPANPVVILPGPAVPSQPGPQVLPPGPSQPEPQVLPPALVCGGATVIANGDFESGFTNGVGNNWASFNNGGSATHGFYDEMWTPVIKDGQHGQLIEINTWGLAASEPDRFAGVRQVVGGLMPGATYELSAWGMIREEAAHPGEDPFRYRVQWGYAPADADPSEADITNWTELPWDTLYVRTAPGSMSSFSARFTAPSSNVVVAFRAWKKWGTVQRELNVNLDAIKLVACSTSGVTPPIVIKPPIGVVPPIEVKPCYYVVKEGDTLAAIAAAHGTTQEQLAAANGIRNPNILILGQRLVVPCKGGDAKPPAGACTWYTVRAGDTLTKIAARYGTTVQAIAQRNGLRNVNLIYVGQRLCIP